MILVDLILGNTNEYLLIIHKFLSIFWGQANNEIVYLFIITTFFIRILFIYFSNIFQNLIIKKISINLSNKVFKKIFETNYKDYLKKHSGNFVASTNNSNVVVSIIRSSLFTISDFFIFLFIFLYLINLSYILSLVVIVIFSTIILFYFFFFRNRFNKISSNKKIYTFQKTSFQQDTLKSFFEIKLFNAEKIILNKFNEIITNYYDVIFKNNNLIVIPRLLLELTIICMIVIMPIFLTKVLNLSFEQYSTILLAFMLASIRFLPLINRISISLQEILINRKVLENFFNFFQVEDDKNSQIYENTKHIIKPLRNKLVLKDVSFFYDEKKILNNVNLTINKNEKILINGENGSGKSTLLNIISGLINPTKGEIFCDDEAIKDNMSLKIAYVSQFPLFLDDTILNNITLGKKNNQINIDLVNQVLKQVNLYEIINKFEKGLDANLGENAKSFSGGQKQRLAIARALYLKPDILLLDEATSSLDINNENIILNLLLNLDNMTIILVSHKKNNKLNFTKEYTIKDNKVYEQNKKI